ncbi:MULTISPECIES: DMT family transporter [Leptospira]|uniref:DMT family transporter n=2 Tax=Leptospira TaxID=171 RepID=A0AAW5VP50_9LEPT|nr:MULTISPECIES: DMT family transporter [Leptospira]MCG6143207.1 DMT family transporter [Leptospira bandrabouensis]MCG6151759.1 DMT family transporter [Leptospira bandrabouensis]MCG6158867.1 DMT family transporter [Leptospira bandrabouensis]MCG6162802.1 DMT family transporter [Leptospira bandrabouensis]MCW7458350.1 DMT family transporter [Leptospira bandrabouensis]
MTGNEKKGYFFVFLTGVFFAFEVIGFKEIFRKYQLEPEIAAFFGVGFSFLVVTPYFLISKRRRFKVTTTIKRDGFILTLGTISNAIGIVLYYFALKQTDLGPAAILIKTTVLYNVLLGVFFLGERLRKTEVFGIAIAILGIYMISTLEGQINFLSTFCILLSAFLFAIQSYMIKKYIPEILGLEYAYLRLFLLSLFFLVYSLYIGSFHVPEISIIVTLGLFSLLGYFLGRAFYFEAHNYLPISKLNATLLIEPIFLMFVGILFMKEPFDEQKLAGAGIILTGLYLIVFHKRKGKP